LFIVDIDGPILTPEDHQVISHPAVCGVIFFTRNFTDAEQLHELVRTIRMFKPNALICVDHEGGRVQRFRDTFTELPSAGSIGQLYDSDPLAAEELAYQCGWLLASELLAFDIDFSFAPVVDVDRQRCEVIGNRAFHQQESIVSLLAGHSIRGMHDAGMATVIKHFPGHGSVSADSHLSLPIDQREFAEIERSDLRPFRDLCAQADAVMPAHIAYTKVDEYAAGFSRTWLDRVLRQQLGFKGVIISDDLSMAGAASAGDICDRAQLAYNAGCDLMLVCNDRSAVKQLLEQEWPQVSAQPLARMRRQRSLSWQELQQDAIWQQAVQAINEHKAKEIYAEAT
jgi:beta-N-acetylhexosaminidase